MVATVVPSSNATLEVLHLYNYEHWSLLVKTYLTGEGLWDVVDGKATPPPSGTTEHTNWMMKNGKALHAIQISCRSDVIGFIGDIEMANEAWDTLRKRLKPKEMARDIKGMAATLVPSVIFDIGALCEHNYEDWRFWVKTYLVAENLWEVVEDTREPPLQKDGKAIFMAWRKNNARALHVIILFCGEDAESFIEDCTSAKDAWNNLAKKFSPPPEVDEILGSNAEVDDLHNDDGTSSNDGDADFTLASLFRGPSLAVVDIFEMVNDMRWEAVRELVEQHPDVLTVEIRFPRRWTLLGFSGPNTLLGLVIQRESVDGVKALLSLMEKKDLFVATCNGDTAISSAIICSQWTDNAHDSLEIIKCIVEKNKKLLTSDVSPHIHVVPLLYVLNQNRPCMPLVDYLYSVTPVEMLKIKDAAQLLSTCLRLKRLDISTDLIKRFGLLIFSIDHSGETPFNELARERDGLFGKIRPLEIWKRLIYQCVQVPNISSYSGQDISITIPKEDNSQEDQNLLIHKVKCLFGSFYTILRNLTGIDSAYQMKLLHHQTKIFLGYLRQCDCSYFVIDKPSSDIQKLVEKALFQIVERGHAGIIQFFPSSPNRETNNISGLFSMKNEAGKTLIHYAAEHRRHEIINSIQSKFSYENPNQMSIGTLGGRDMFGNNMLHTVGKLSSKTVSGHIRGAALQMQYELQWFKKIEKMASLEDINCINLDGRTPREEFTFNHRDLVEAGEKSMKETATSSSALVAALIITIMFAAAVTVPGGIDGNTGIPIYLRTKAFRIFMVADVISLCSATTSVMVFLGILTSRFAEEDFLTSLPTKLIIGFLTLFLSVGSMMVAFSIVVYIMLPGEPSIVIASTVLAGIPIASFLWMQFPFLVEVIISTYGPNFWYDHRRT